MSFSMTSAKLFSGAGQGKSGSGQIQNFASRLNLTDWLQNKLFKYPVGDNSLDHKDHEYIQNLNRRLKDWLKGLWDNFMAGVKNLMIELIGMTFNALISKVLDKIGFNKLMSGLGNIEKKILGGIEKLKDGILNMFEKKDKKTVKRIWTPIKPAGSKNNLPWDIIEEERKPNIFQKSVGQFTTPSVTGQKVTDQVFTVTDFYEKFTTNSDYYSIAMKHLFYVKFTFEQDAVILGRKDLSRLFNQNTKQEINYFTKDVEIPNVQFADMDAENNEFGYMHVTSGKLLPDTNTFTMQLLDTDVPVLENVFLPWMQQIGGSGFASPTRPFDKALVEVVFFKMDDNITIAKRNALLEARNISSQLNVSNREYLNGQINKLLEYYTENISYITYRFYGVIPKSFITRNPSHDSASDFYRSITFQFENMNILRTKSDNNLSPVYNFESNLETTDLNKGKELTAAYVGLYANKGQPALGTANRNILDGTGTKESQYATEADGVAGLKAKYGNL